MAILMVLCGHFFDLPGIWEDRMGVDVFFVLSGMLMSVILFEKRMSLKDFYIRRLSRILPVFFVCVLAMYSLGFALSVEFSWMEFLSSLLFLRTYLPVEPHIWSSGVTIAHLWSLNIEEHAYIFLSVVSVVLINRRFIAVVLLVVGVALVIFGLYKFTQMAESDYRLYIIRTESAVVFILFSAGYGLLARQYQFALPSGVPVACLLLALLCYATAAPLWLIPSLSPVLLAVSVNHLKDFPALLHRCLANVVVRHFGLWSFSIYLWQQFYFEFAWRFPGGRITALLLAVITGMASYYLLEQPCRRWINNRWSAEPRYRVA